MLFRIKLTPVLYACLWPFTTEQDDPATPVGQIGLSEFSPRMPRGGGAVGLGTERSRRMYCAVLATSGFIGASNPKTNGVIPKGPIDQDTNLPLSAMKAFIRFEGQRRE